MPPPTFWPLPKYGVQIDINPSPDGRAHMRVYWDKTNDWSGWFNSPDEAWAAAKRRVLKELGLDLGKRDA